MAYELATERMREIIYSGDATYDCKLYFNNTLIPVEQIASIKISSPINFLPPSTTIIVPSSRYPIPCADSLPSFITTIFISSPGRTTGFIALAKSFIFKTGTPWNSATLFKLKSFVITFPPNFWANFNNLLSTSAISLKSPSQISVSTSNSFWILLLFVEI